MILYNILRNFSRYFNTYLNTYLNTYFSVLFLLFPTPAIFSQARQDPEVLNIGSRRELFVDSFLIERMNNVSLVLHEPVDEGPVLYFDKPWEGAFCAYATIIKEGHKYRLYYRGMPDAGGDGSRQETTCYAESDDGIHWVKPALGIYEIDGSRENNVILANAAPVTHNFSPFLDTREGFPPDRRFKALGGISESGLIAWSSPDGIHWKKLQEESVITEGAFDSQNVSFWSQHEQKYLCYFRTWTKVNGTNYRTVSRVTSDDFIHWTKPVEMDFGKTPREQLYTNQTAPYYRAPHIYISIAARFMPHRQVLSEAQAKQLHVNPAYFKDCSDAVFITSRGGNHYTRTFMEGFIRPGIGLQNWVSRSNYPALNVVQTSPAEMSVYLNEDYAQPTAHLHRYSLRIDGFTSVRAPYSGGEWITKPFRFSGDTLSINFSTSAAGYVKIEIQDIKGNPFDGFTLDDARELIGNEIEKTVTWKNHLSPGLPEGKVIRLRFFMKDADIYSLRIH